MALSYWAHGDWSCENKHLNSINLFNLHSKVEISPLGASRVFPLNYTHLYLIGNKYAKYQLRKNLIFLMC